MGAYKAAMQTYNSQQESQNSLLRAAAARVSGESARRAGATNAFTTLLAGGASLFDKFGKIDRPKPAGITSDVNQDAGIEPYWNVG